MPCGIVVSCGISTGFPVLFPTERKVAHALLTRPPLEVEPKSNSPLDLHVLSTPPAFVLSQDQTLSFNPVYTSPGFSTRQSSTHSELLSLFCVSCSVSFSRFSACSAISREQACLSYHHTKEKSTPFCRFFELFSSLFRISNIRFWAISECSVNKSNIPGITRQGCSFFQHPGFARQQRHRCTFPPDRAPRSARA